MPRKQSKEVKPNWAYDDTETGLPTFETNEHIV